MILIVGIRVFLNTWLFYWKSFTEKTTTAKQVNNQNINNNKKQGKEPNLCCSLQMVPSPKTNVTLTWPQLPVLQVWKHEMHHFSMFHQSVISGGSVCVSDSQTNSYWSIIHLKGIKTEQENDQKSYPGLDKCNYPQQKTASVPSLFYVLCSALSHQSQIITLYPSQNLRVISTGDRGTCPPYFSKSYLFPPKLTVPACECYTLAVQLPKSQIRPGVKPGIEILENSSRFIYLLFWMRLCLSTV